MAKNKILFAHSSIILRKIITLALKDQEYELMFVSNANEIIDKINQLRPDMCLIEHLFPGKDAFAIKAEYDAQKTGTVPVFVLLIGETDFIDEDAIRDGNFTDRLETPFDPTSLRKLLARILSTEA